MTANDTLTPGSLAPQADASLLEVRGLVRDYALPRERLLGPAPQLRALDGVDFTLAAGRSLGVVGESGSGKSTLARLVMALDTPTAGTVRLRGRDLHALRPAELRAARRDVQMVFQDPYGSLDPRMTVERIVAEPLAALEGLPRPMLRERVAEVLAQVGLRPADAGKGFAAPVLQFGNALVYQPGGGRILCRRSFGSFSFVVRILSGHGRTSIPLQRARRYQE